jgi:hypothetical protein
MTALGWPVASLRAIRLISHGFQPCRFSRKYSLANHLIGCAARPTDFAADRDPQRDLHPLVPRNEEIGVNLSFGGTGQANEFGPLGFGRLSSGKSATACCLFIG